MYKVTIQYTRECSRYPSETMIADDVDVSTLGWVMVYASCALSVVPELMIRADMVESIKVEIAAY